ncbi:MAG: hypothetical protein A3B04_01740 [Candidatus Portnoybacteria bacterium RIFCSPLOWO2_02_FULL_39_11]|uniref:Methyltransferase type 11 domain-containing protein n=1 Tax=Candidatus Portnoybacteria bacterium RIFCSPLOWO2_02_FULL_39_11 TaxID=1802001 RepID=A0A1G2FNY2_9BACT|nr:MAG: hypothetical protein A3B04_01740 [Candidatus Portnoybacteria bacterium RIFCSPLOWO2_02_FULL_39_11]
MDINEAKKIMELNKHFYNLLAEDFSRTRANIWEEFKSLGEYWQDRDQVLDLGCGNGRFYDLVCRPGKNIKYFGVDNSERLIAMAKQNYPQGQFILNDGLELPFGDEFFDKVLCIAVLHHLPGYDLRREFLRQARRVLKKDGLLVLTTWFAAPGKRRWRNLLKYSWLKIIGRSKLDWGDFYEPWGNKGVRYFHNFSAKEMRNLLEDVGFKIESIGFLTRKSGEKNLVVVARK